MTISQLYKKMGPFCVLTLFAGIFAGSAVWAKVPVETAQSSGQSGYAGNNGVSYNATADLLNTIEQLKQEMGQLRGLVEEQGFKIQQLQQEGRDRYLDLDSRISQLNTGTSGKISSRPSGQLAVGTDKTKSVTVTQTAEEQGAYKEAFSLVENKQFDKALVSLKQFITQYPKGRYASNAWYWIGEVQMAQGDYNDAIESFQAVLKRYPDSSKEADATYKLGRLYDISGNQSQARQYLQSVVKQFPNSGAARLADSYLDSMGNE
ncbi:Cell division coordinator CpoB [invertebrate metagenome]|uniref:Cell division coordinator CpoB n=1 Tax=invertebrate metagenome TaxID=1711999 RepID=A0A2H9TAY9_9ZZZZ